MRSLKVHMIVIATMALALVFAGMPGTAEAGVCSSVGKAAGCVNAKDVKNNSLTGTDVRDNSLTAADVADNSLTAADVADNSLTAADSNDEAGADFVEQDNVALTGAPQVIASVQVTAPGSGVVIANASGWFNMGTPANAVICALSQDANLPAAFFPLIVEDHANDPGQADDDEAFALTRGFQVSAGTTTVNLVCQGGNTASVAGVALTAMYFPTRY